MRLSFGDVDMIGVCDVISVCNSLYDTETVLKTFCEFIRCGLKRCTVNRIVYILGSLPLGAGIVKPLHYAQTKLLALFSVNFCLLSHKRIPKVRHSRARAWNNRREEAYR